MDKEWKKCGDCYFFAPLYHWNYSKGRKLLGYVCTMHWEMERSVVNNCKPTDCQCEMWAPQNVNVEILNSNQHTKA